MAKTNKRTKTVEEPLTKNTPSKKRKIESASVVNKKPAVKKRDASTVVVRRRRGGPTTVKSVSTITKTFPKVKTGSRSKSAAPTKKETKRKSVTARTKDVEDANVTASAPVEEDTTFSRTDEHQATATKNFLGKKIGSTRKPAAPTKKETKRESATARTKGIASAPVRKDTTSSRTDEHQATATKNFLRVKIGINTRKPAAPAKKETKRKSVTSRTKGIARAPVREGTTSSSADEQQISRVAKTKKADSKKTIPEKPKKAPSKKRTKVDNASESSNKSRPTPKGRPKKVTKSVIVDAVADSTQKKRGRPAAKKKTAPLKSSTSKVKVKNPRKRTQRVKVK